MGALDVRVARESDLERLVEIHACAYPEPGGYQRHARHLTRNAFGGLECLRVVEKDGVLVAFGAIGRLELWLGGHQVPTSGVASVAVAPEARREGVAHFLLESLHAEALADACALSLLYPFEQAFYARHGYASLSPVLSLKIACDAIEPPSAHGASALRWTPVRVEGDVALEARALYEEVCARTSGRVARSEARWTELVARDDRHWLGITSSEGKLEAYASFSYDGRAMSRQQALVVHELTAKSSNASRALLRVLGNQRDQIADIELTLAYGDPLVFAFEDAAGSRRGPDLVSHTLGSIAAGPMVRILDLRRALARRGYAGDGDLTFACTGGSSTRVVRLVVRDGHVEVLEGASTADVELSELTLASIVAAGLRPVEAAELGLLRASPTALPIVERLFSGPRFLCLDPF